QPPKPRRNSLLNPREREGGRRPAPQPDEPLDRRPPSHFERKRHPKSLSRLPKNPRQSPQQHEPQTNGQQHADPIPRPPVPVPHCQRFQRTSLALLAHSFRIRRPELSATFRTNAAQIPHQYVTAPPAPRLIWPNALRSRRIGNPPDQLDDEPHRNAKH